MTETVEELRGLFSRILPISTHDTPDYAELTFGDHQTQAMTMDPQTWLAIGEAIPSLLSTLEASQARAGEIYLAGFSAGRAAAVAVVQRHLEPRVARRLIAAEPPLDGARGGFLLAVYHLRDDIDAMADPTADQIARATLTDITDPHAGGEE